MDKESLIVLKQWYVIRKNKATGRQAIIYGGFKTSLEAQMYADQDIEDKIISIPNNHVNQYIITNGDWRNIMPPKNLQSHRPIA